MNDAKSQPGNHGQKTQTHKLAEFFHKNPFFGQTSLSRSALPLSNFSTSRGEMKSLKC